MSFLGATLGPSPSYAPGMADETLTFAEKIKTLHIGGIAPKTKTRIDDHGTHRVAVTEHNSKDDRVDVKVIPGAVKGGAR